MCVLRVSLGAHLSWAANQSASPTNATNQLTHAGAGRYTSWGDAWFLFSILYILSKVSLHASATFATEYLDVRADQPTFSLLQSILKSLFTAEEWPSTLAEFFGADVILTDIIFGAMVLARQCKGRKRDPRTGAYHASSSTVAIDREGGDFSDYGEDDDDGADGDESKRGATTIGDGPPPTTAVALQREQEALRRRERELLRMQEQLRQRRQLLEERLTTTTTTTTTTTAATTTEGVEDGLGWAASSSSATQPLLSPSQQQQPEEGMTDVF